MKQLSLWTKLYLLILVVIIPLTILQIVGIVQRYEQAFESEYMNNQELAEACGATFLNYFQHVWNIQQAVGLTITREDLSILEMEAYMREIAEGHPTIKRISWIGPDGVTIASTYPNFRQVDLSDRSYVQRIQQGEDEVVSDLLQSRATNNMVLPVVRSVRKDGQLIGIILTVVELENLASILSVDRHYQSGSIGVFDSQGQIVFRHSKNDFAVLGTPLDEQSPLRESLQGEVVRDRYTCPNEPNERMGTSVPIASIGWGAFASVSVEEVFADIWADTKRDVFFLSLTILASLILALLTGQQFLQPLSVLRDAAQSIFLGDLTARTHLSGNDELAKTGQIFDQMAERIQQLEESRTQFIQTAAHELRNPMAGIKGMLALIQRRIDTGQSVSDGRIGQMLGLMEKEIDRLSKLLNQILEAFRVQKEEGLLDLKLEKIDLKELIKVVLDPFQVPGAFQCTFTYVGIDQPVQVMGNYSRLEDVLRNLFHNAVKYSPEGGQVTIQLSEEDDYAMITVIDQGIGIPEQRLEQIFECFYRVDYPYENDPGGMGLGLHICKRIIESHGGKIWATSQVGSGSKFHLKLPLH